MWFEYNGRMVEAEDVFNPKDFESLKLIIAFKNLTTRTEVRDKSKCNLQEVGERTLIFEVPAKSCNTNHNVLVEIKKIDTKTKKEKELLSVTGKILEIEDVGDDCLRVSVDCMQYDEKSWKELIGFYSSRQAEIEKFFASVRGY